MALEYFSLLALGNFPGGVSGPDLRKFMETAMDRKLTSGAFHGTLARLEQKGQITSVFMQEKSPNGGPPRKSYALTREGALHVQNELAIRERMAKGLNLRKICAPYQKNRAQSPAKPSKAK